MKAIIYSNYGPPDVLEYKEILKPTPGEDEVLIRVRAASVNPADWHFMRGEPYFGRMMMGLRKPKTMRFGIDVAGQVDAVGAKVTQFKPGDEVFGSCSGAFAEYATAPESALVTKPANVTFEQAGAIAVAANTALQSLRRGEVQAGKKVLINGAAGGVGTFAVQIAKCFGADVTGVCSTRNVEMVRSLGADRVIDYTQEDFTKERQRYDLFLDCIGNHSLSASRRVLNPRGICIIVGAESGRWIDPLPRFLKALLISRFSSRKFAGVLAKSNKEDLTLLRDLLETGKITPVIDRRYPLSEVPRAIRYLEEGHARGKVVITVG